MNRAFGVHPLGCSATGDTLKRGHQTGVGSWSQCAPQMASSLSMNPGNIEHPTSNAQHPMNTQTECHWMFDVGCFASVQGFKARKISGNSHPALSMNRPKPRQVLDCASPLALFQWANAVAKAAEDCRSPRRWRENESAIRFMAPMRVQSWRSRLPMNLVGHATRRPPRGPEKARSVWSAPAPAGAFPISHSADSCRRTLPPCGTDARAKAPSGSRAQFADARPWNLPMNRRGFIAASRQSAAIR